MCVAEWVANQSGLPHGQCLRVHPSHNQLMIIERSEHGHIVDIDSNKVSKSNFIKPSNRYSVTIAIYNHYNLDIIHVT